MKKGFYIRTKAQSAKEPVQPRLKPLLYLVPIFAAALLVLIWAFGIFGWLWEYTSARGMIANGEIVSGRSRLEELGDFLDAESYLDKTREAHARQLLSDGQFLDAYLLLKDTELDQELVIGKVIQQRGNLSAQEGELLAKRLVPLLKLYYASSNNDSLYKKLEELYLETSVLDADEKILHELYERQMQCLEMLEGCQVINPSVLKHCGQILEKLGFMVEPEVKNRYLALLSGEERETSVSLEVEIPEGTPKPSDTPLPGWHYENGFMPYELNLPWPQLTQETRLRVHVPENGESWAYGIGRYKTQYYSFRCTQSEEDSVLQGLNFLNQHAALADAMVIVAYGDEDYSQVIEAANRVGMPLVIFGFYDRDRIRGVMEELFAGKVQAQHAPSVQTTPAPTPEPSPSPTPDSLSGWMPDLKTARYPLNLPWPQKNASIHVRVFVHAWKQTTFDEIQVMMRQSQLPMGYYRLSMQTYRSQEDAVQGAVEYLHGTLDYYDFLKEEDKHADAMIIVAYGDEDYTQVIDLATKKGVAVWVVDDYQKLLMKQDVQRLTGVDSLTVDPGITASPKPTSVPDEEMQAETGLLTSSYPLNLPWPDDPKMARVQVLVHSWKQTPRIDINKILYEISEHWNHHTAQNVEYRDAEESVALAMECVDGKRGMVDALIILPCEGADYSEVIDHATKTGMPVLLADHYDKDLMRTDLIHLFDGQIAAEHQHEKTQLRDVSRELNCPWTQSATPNLLFLCTLDTHANPYLQTNIRLLMNEIYGEDQAHWQYSYAANAKESEDLLMKTIRDGGPSRYGALDGILVIPYEDADYSEAIELASQKGIPVWLFGANTDYAVSRELRALYRSAHPVGSEEEIRKLPSLRRPWPQEDNAKIRVLYTRDNADRLESDVLYLAIASLGGKHLDISSRNCVNADASEGEIKRCARYEEVDAILVFPYDGAEYTAAVEDATQFGIPVWVFSDRSEETVKKELAALYGIHPDE